MNATDRDDRDDLDVPHGVCRKCNGYVPQIEIERGLCLDCQIDKQKLRKKKGYKSQCNESV